MLVGTHCGVERLGLPVNDVFWITDEADEDSTDWLPDAWSKSVDSELIRVAGRRKLTEVVYTLGPL